MDFLNEEPIQVRMGAEWSRRELFQTVWGNHCLTMEPFRKRDDETFQHLAKKMQEEIDKAERSNQIKDYVLYKEDGWKMYEMQVKMYGIYRKGLRVSTLINGRAGRKKIIR